MILGIDEVGRGSLAGPVSLAGVLLNSTYPKFCFKFNPDTWLETDFEYFKIVTDSKVLSKRNREKVFNLCLDSKIDYIVLSASNKLIDEFGIGVCLSYLVSLTMFFLGSSNKITEIVIDGKIKILKSLNSVLLSLILDENVKQIQPSNYIKLKSLIYKNDKKDLLFKNEVVEIIEESVYQKILRENKADFKYLSVAMASNIAKVLRDLSMDEFSQRYPIFNWHLNKGYGTEYHREIIKSYPENELLRQTFLSKILKRKT